MKVGGKSSGGYTGKLSKGWRSGFDLNKLYAFLEFSINKCDFFKKKMKIKTILKENQILTHLFISLLLQASRYCLLYDPLCPGGRGREDKEVMMQTLRDSNTEILYY